MTLTDRYKEFEQSLGSVDSDWVVFIKDHRDELLQRATKEVYGPGDLYRYRYRPASFIESKNLPLSSEWILLWMNNLKSRVNFTDITELYIPSIEHLIELHDKFEQLTVSKQEA